MKTKIRFVICLLFGLMFINAGLDKFLHYMPMPEDIPADMINLMTAMMEISWLIPLVGIFELIGGVLFIFPRYRALGAMILLPILVGITLTNITAAPSGLPLVIILLAIEGWIILENRQKYLVMIK
ncbi:DoxX family membrane protein [Roseivirga sp.]|uniref:DoxX family membrane protein n=1 Tax=Roseivirga sp. TaxID=1964215 RepID=UPI003B521373